MTVREMLINFGHGGNTIPAIAPLAEGGVHRVTYNGRPLPESDLSRSLPALGCKITNNSRQDIFVQFNNDGDRGDIIGRGGVERVFTGFTISDVFISNRGDDTINTGEVEITLFTDQTALVNYYRLLRLQNLKLIPNVLPNSLVGGGF